MSQHTSLREPAGHAAESLRFTIGSHVRTAQSEDGLVLLDLRSGRYSAFNAVGGLVWSKIGEGRSAAAIVRELHETFGEIPREQIRNDVGAILEKLISDRLIQPTRDQHQDLTPPVIAEPEQVPGSTVPPESEMAIATADRTSVEVDLTEAETSVSALGDSFWYVVAGATLVYMDLILWFRHFPRLYAKIRDHRPADRRVSTATAQRVVQAVDKAARMYFKRAWCLQRSAACVYLLRRMGFAAKLALGVRILPFEAHAWVEIDGRVVNDRKERIQRFLVLDRV